MAEHQERLKLDAARKDAEIAMLYSGGATMQEIAAAIGVSRERVRQRLERAGVTERHPKGGRGRHVDPLLICRAAETAPNLRALAREAGCSTTSAIKVLQALGKWDAFQGRVRADRQTATRRRQLWRLRQLGLKLGRTPGVKDLLEAGMTHTGYFASFGSLQKAQALVGFMPRGVGGTGHRPGTRPSPEEQATIRRLFAQGLSLNAISRQTGWAFGVARDVVRRERGYAEGARPVQQPIGGTT